MKKIIFTVLFLLLSGVQVHATTYYVSPTGDNSRSCATAQTSTTPKLTILNAWENCLVAGDTLYLKAGTYTEAIDAGNLAGLPSGTSWSSPITISNAPSESVTWKPPAGLAAWTAGYTSYIIFNGIIFDGSNSTSDTPLFGIECAYVGGWVPSSCSHHIRLTDNTFNNAGGNDVIINNPTDSSGQNGCCNEFIRNVFKNGGRFAGADQAESMYVHSANNLWEYNTWQNGGGTAISLRNGWIQSGVNDNIVRFNFFNDWVDDAWTAGGVYSQANSGNQIYGNVFSNVVGAAVDLNTNNNIVYNNTVYLAGQDPGGGQGQFSTACIHAFVGSSGNTIKNNLLIDCPGGGYANDGGAQTTSNNITTGTAASHFVSVAADNYSLTQTSAAIDAGTSSITGSITLTCAGTCDVGAFEVPKASSCSATGNTLSILFDNPRFPPLSNLAVTGITGTIDG